MLNVQNLTSSVRYKITIKKDEIPSDTFSPYKEIGKGFQ
jgi:hypothetical protein